jgi:hypothetical protein
MSNLNLVRTKFVDERLRRAVENGATQVAIHGATDLALPQDAELLVRAGRGRRCSVLNMRGRGLTERPAGRLREAEVSYLFCFAMTSLRHRNLPDVIRVVESPV